MDCISKYLKHIKSRTCWYCKPQKWRKWVNFLVIKHFCRFAFSIIKSDPFLLFPCFAAEKNGNCKISNLMLASMPFEFYYIFTKAYLEFFCWKRGYCAYITSLTVTIFFLKACMHVRACVYVYVWVRVECIKFTL